MEQTPATTDITGQASPTNNVDNKADTATLNKEDTVSKEDTSRLAALARQQKAIREQQRKFEAEKHAWETEKQSLLARAQKADTETSLRDKLLRDPYGAMLDAGLTADQAASLMLNQPSPADQKIALLEEKLAKLEGKHSESLDKISERDKQQYQEAKKQIGNDIKLLVDSDSSFETIKAMDAQESVVELIERVYADEGILLNIEDACKEVEDYLTEEAFKYASLNKVKSKLNPTPQAPVEQKIQGEQKTPIKTISNQMAPSTTKSLTEKERKQRAIAAFNGQLT